jgi:hypothetical protein
LAPKPRRRSGRPQAITAGSGRYDTSICSSASVISDRSLCYSDPEAEFATVAHRITLTTTYPRNSGTPIERFVVIAEYLPGEAFMR